MNFIVTLAVIILAVYFFKDDIHGFIVGDLKNVPQQVQQYNSKALGLEYFKAHGEEALTLKGICMQHSGWRYENDLTRNFAQNCNDAEAAFK
jgi:hypothetical protein